MVGSIAALLQFTIQIATIKTKIMLGADLISSLITDNNATTACATAGEDGKDILSLSEVEKILKDVRADNVKVIPVQNQSFTDHVVLATGRSVWHVRNIAQALFYKAKLKQRGGVKKILPTVEGQKGGKWIVVDSGSLVIHALDEKMRAYYNLDALWTEERSMKLTSEESQPVRTRTWKAVW